jgi:Protein of unknown function (DUF4239)
MLTFTGNCLAVAAVVVCSLLFMAGLNYIWPWEKRRNHNDLIGWQLSILGTTYAVIMGFMLYAVWTSFQEAALNADLESNSVANVHHLADGLPEPQRTQLLALSRAYVEAAISGDWPQMARGQLPEKTVEINKEMWGAAMSVRPTSPAEQTAEDHMLSELIALSQHRMTRLMQSTYRLPNVLWCVLLVGGVLTIVSACTFGSPSTKLHALQVFSFALLISLALIAITDIYRPFQGLIHVKDYAFRRVQQNMQGH